MINNPTILPIYARSGTAPPIANQGAYLCGVGNLGHVTVHRPGTAPIRTFIDIRHEQELLRQR